MVKFWEEKDYWFYYKGVWFFFKEVWDDERFSEVFWFWDLNFEWLLLIRCDFCLVVLSVEEIESFFFDGNNYIVICSECGLKIICKGEKVRGDFRNIVLIGYWDGWYLF